MPTIDEARIRAALPREIAAAQQDTAFAVLTLWHRLNIAEEAVGNLAKRGEDAVASMKATAAQIVEDARAREEGRAAIRAPVVEALADVADRIRSLDDLDLAAAIPSGLTPAVSRLMDTINAMRDEIPPEWRIPRQNAVETIRALVDRCRKSESMVRHWQSNHADMVRINSELRLLASFKAPTGEGGQMPALISETSSQLHQIVSDTMASVQGAFDLAMAKVRGVLSPLDASGDPPPAPPAEESEWGTPARPEAWPASSP